MHSGLRGCHLVRDDLNLGLLVVLKPTSLWGQGSWCSGEVISTQLGVALCKTILTNILLTTLRI